MGDFKGVKEMGLHHYLVGVLRPNSNGDGKGLKEDNGGMENSCATGKAEERGECCGLRALSGDGGLKPKG